MAVTTSLSDCQKLIVAALKKSFQKAKPILGKLFIEAIRILKRLNSGE